MHNRRFDTEQDKGAISNKDDDKSGFKKAV